MDQNTSILVGLLVGYVVSIFVGDLVIRPIRNKMYEGFEETDELHRWRVQVIGWLERFLYTTSILIGSPEFIAVWLALKVAGQWDRWRLDIGSKAAIGTVRARATYSVYLVGNGLSILFGGAGAILFRMIGNDQWQLASSLILGLVIVNVLLFEFIKRKVEIQNAALVSKENESLEEEAS
jgi:hypothetical protein